MRFLKRLRMRLTGREDAARSMMEVLTYLREVRDLERDFIKWDMRFGEFKTKGEVLLPQPKEKEGVEAVSDAEKILERKKRRTGLVELLEMLGETLLKVASQWREESEAPGE